MTLVRSRLRGGESHTLLTNFWSADTTGLPCSLGVIGRDTIFEYLKITMSMPDMVPD